MTVRYTGADVGFHLGRRDVLLLVGLVGLAVLARLHFDDYRLIVGQASVFLAMGLLLSRHATVRATLRSLDPGRRVLVVLLPALVIAGHVVNLDDRPYPFVTWELYTSSLPGNPSYHEFTATLASGRVIPLPARDLFPTLSGRVSVLLQRVSGRALHSRAGPAQARATANAEPLLRGLAREYERRYADGPVHAIDIWHRTIPAASYQGRASIARHHEWRVDVR